VAAPGSRAEFLEFAESFAIDSLDPRRPLWQATLLEAEGETSCTLLVKVSHALMDGQAAIELLAAFVDLEPDARDTAPPSRPAPRQLTALELTAERLVAFPWDAQRRTLSRAFALTRNNSRVLAHPKATAGQAAAYAGSLKRLLTSPAAAGSGVLRGRSAGRRLVTVEVPQTGLRAAGKAADGTLNDAYLAGVLGGLRRYHEALGSPVQEIPFAIPINTRESSVPGAEVGNRFAPVRFSAPMGVADPAERIRCVSQLVRAARDEPALDAMTSLAPALAQLPALVHGLLAREQDKLDAQASNVPGPAFTVFLAGTEVRRLFAFGPLPGPAVMAVLVTYAGTCCVGFTLDTSAVTDVELFERCAREGFAEVLSLDPSAPDLSGSS
jgi:WS/DGAT/MGAT family acyltransferase